MTNEEAIAILEKQSNFNRRFQHYFEATSVEIKKDKVISPMLVADRYRELAEAMDIAIAKLKNKSMGDPLTLEQLREMDGQPVWVKVIGKTGIRCDGWCEVEIREKDPFAYVWWPGSEVEDIAKIEDYGKTWACYAYQPAHIDREAWTAEWKDHYKSGVHAGTGAICSSCDVWNERKTHICPFCGKAMDEDGFAMLEKRMGVR